MNKMEFRVDWSWEYEVDVEQGDNQEEKNYKCDFSISEEGKSKNEKSFSIYFHFKLNHSTLFILHNTKVYIYSHL